MRQTPLTLAILFGVSAGVGALTRTVVGLMFAGLCIAGILWCTDGEHRSRLATRVVATSIAGAVFLGTLAPWVVRNHDLTGEYVLSTEAWQALAMANNDSGGVYFTSAGLAAMPQVSIVQTEIEREAIYKAFVVDWISKHPATFVQLYAQRAFLFWSPFLHSVSGTRRWLGAAFNAMLLIGVGTCILAQRVRWRHLLPVYVTLLTFTFSYSLAFVTTRFRLPAYPLVEILAAGGILAVLDGLEPSMLRVAR